jgi:hypothetical protein
MPIPGSPGQDDMRLMKPISGELVIDCPRAFKAFTSRERQVRGRAGAGVIRTICSVAVP